VRGYLSEGREQLAGMLTLPLPCPHQASALQAPPSQSQAPLQHLSRANALHGAGALAFYQGDYTASHSLHEEGLAIRRELGDKQGIAASLSNLGNVAAERGDYATAHSLHEEGLAIRRELGDKRGI